MLDILIGCTLMVFYTVVGIIELAVIVLIPLAVISLVIFLIDRRD